MTVYQMFSITITLIEKKNMMNMIIFSKPKLRMTQKTFSQKMFMMSPMCFFYETHVKAAIKGLNKNSSPGPDKITPVLIQNGGENFTKSLPYIEIAIS